MDTKEILSHAYAELFCLEVINPDGYYSGQSYEDCVIDYAIFDHDAKDYDYNKDYFEAITEDGCEGCWIGIFLEHYDYDKQSIQRYRVGTIKTLDEGREAWRIMGALAGELAYVANETAYKLHWAEEREKDNQ